MRIPMKVTLNHNEAVMPKYMTEGAAAFDLYSVEQVVINPGQTTVVNTGIIFEVPVGYEVQIRPRSGMSANTKIRVANSPGTIDSDYRGEIKIILDNTGTEAYTINVGDRIAQGKLSEVPIADFIIVESHELEKTARGDKGIGHSGK